MTTALITRCPEALARISGKCRLCSTRIVAGRHYVARLPRIGWVHSECATGHQRLLAEHEEES